MTLESRGSAQGWALGLGEGEPLHSVADQERGCCAPARTSPRLQGWRWRRSSPPLCPLTLARGVQVEALVFQLSPGPRGTEGGDEWASWPVGKAEEGAWTGPCEQGTGSCSGGPGQGGARSAWWPDPHPPSPKHPQLVSKPPAAPHSPLPPLSCQTAICCHGDGSRKGRRRRVLPPLSCTFSWAWAQSRPPAAAPAGLRAPAPPGRPGLSHAAPSHVPRPMRRPGEASPPLQPPGPLPGHTRVPAPPGALSRPGAWLLAVPPEPAPLVSTRSPRPPRPPGGRHHASPPAARPRARGAAACAEATTVGAAGRGPHVPATGPGPRFSFSLCPEPWLAPHPKPPFPAAPSRSCCPSPHGGESGRQLAPGHVRATPRPPPRSVPLCACWALSLSAVRLLGHVTHMHPHSAHRQQRLRAPPAQRVTGR